MACQGNGDSKCGVKMASTQKKVNLGTSFAGEVVLSNGNIKLLEIP